MPATDEALKYLITSPEVEAAVQWWTTQLIITSSSTTGDPHADADAELVRSWGASRNDTPTKIQIDWFRKALRALIAVYCAETWKPDNPEWGAACRSVGVDYGPDHILDCALRFGGIRGGVLTLPIKTSMKIGPGKVEVKVGYGGDTVIIYREAP